MSFSVIKLTSKPIKKKFTLSDAKDSLVRIENVGIENVGIENVGIENVRIENVRIENVRIENVGKLK